MEKISAVVPCYNEEEVLGYFYNEICAVAEEMKQTVEFEFLFIDDGSRDNTLKVVKGFAENDDRVHYISFSRNFGKESAMYAGFQNATGDYVVVLDADLQDPPSLIKDMYRYIKEENYDSVATRRVTRCGEPIIRSFFARCFYKFINKISKTEIVDGARDFRLMTRQMVDAILEITEYNRFTKGIYGWIGFETKWIEYENVERVAGKTKWSFWKLLIYSMEGIVGFSTAPLAFSSIVGLVMCLVAVFFIFFIIIRKFIFGDPTSGWPSLVCIILFIGGIQLFCVGILSQYMAKAYLETKNRPIYVVKEKR